MGVMPNNMGDEYANAQRSARGNLSACQLASLSSLAGGLGLYRWNASSSLHDSRTELRRDLEAYLKDWKE